MIDVDVVAVLYESRSMVEPWAATIAAQTDVRLHVTIVDNASRDKGADEAATFLPGARILSNAGNEGFGRAANRGISAGDSSYVFVCNLDLALRPGCIAALVHTLEADEHAGAACGKLLLRDGVLDSTGLQAFAPRLFADRGHGEPDDGRFGAAGEVFGASGAAVLYRRSMLDEVKIGGAVFDPDYFLYWEDIDLAWRARLAGWATRYVPDAVGVHERGSSTGRSARDIGAYSFAHRLFTIDKNDTDASPKTSVHAATALLAAGLARKPEQWGAARSLLSRRAAVRAKRAEVQALRRVSPAEIEAWFEPMSLARWARGRAFR